jgi:hypothetical protein
MWWQFWKNGNNVGNIPERMSRRLGWRFTLSKETLQGLRYASKPGPMKTILVRVFDPNLLDGAAPVIRGYGDLDTQQSAIQFECRWQTRASKLEDVVDFRPTV